MENLEGGNGNTGSSFLADNFLGISILVSAIVIAGTLVFLFGSGDGLGTERETFVPGASEDSGGGVLSVNSLKALAREVGADGDRFDSCLDSGTHADDVQRDVDQGISLGVNGTPSFLINGNLAVGALPFNQISSVIEGALASGEGRDSVDVGDAPFLGDANAPVVMIEFSDYECPFCGRFFSQTLPQVKSEYVDTGKVKFVYKDFPLTSIHFNAQAAAEAARCVRDQLGDDGYWNMHDAVFESQG